MDEKVEEQKVEEKNVEKEVESMNKEKEEQNEESVEETTEQNETRELDLEKIKKLVEEWNEYKNLPLQLYADSNEFIAELETDDCTYVKIYKNENNEYVFENCIFGSWGELEINLEYEDEESLASSTLDFFYENFVVTSPDKTFFEQKIEEIAEEEHKSPLYKHQGEGCGIYLLDDDSLYYNYISVILENNKINRYLVKVREYRNGKEKVKTKKLKDDEY
ncbi:MAG: hypothetical protein QXX68_03510 [Candidatus Pacearchaeota archaeon]